MCSLVRWTEGPFFWCLRTSESSIVLQDAETRELPTCQFVTEGSQYALDHLLWATLDDIGVPKTQISHR